MGFSTLVMFSLRVKIEFVSEQPLSLQLADFVAAHQDAILKEWLRCVWANPLLSKAGHLTETALRDTLPEICQRLCDQLRDVTLTSKCSTSQTLGNTHGEERWLQSF